jgi:hypothetical protein
MTGLLGIRLIRDDTSNFVRNDLVQQEGIHTRIHTKAVAHTEDVTFLVSSCKSSRAFGSRNKAVMESSRAAENMLWIEKRRTFLVSRLYSREYSDTSGNMRKVLNLTLYMLDVEATSRGTHYVLITSVFAERMSFSTHFKA